MHPQKHSVSANWYEPNKKRGMTNDSFLGKAQEKLVGKLETLSSSARTPAAKLKMLDKVFSDVVRSYRLASACNVDASGPGRGVPRAPPYHPTPTYPHTACR